MGLVKIDQEACKGCGLCVNACPKKILRLSETILNLKGFHPSENFDMENCTGCGACALTCPDVCITVWR